jgi:hypothetical protein
MRPPRFPLQTNCTALVDPPNPYSDCSMYTVKETKKNAVRMADTQKNQLDNPTVKPRIRIVAVTKPLSSMPNLMIATFRTGSFQAYQYTNATAVTTAPKRRTNVGSLGNGIPSKSNSAGGPTRAGSPHTTSVTIHFRSRMPRKRLVRLLLAFNMCPPLFLCKVRYDIMYNN